MNTETLQDLRHQAANAAFEAYNFGSGVTVEETSGWEYDSPGSEMSRKVFYAVDEAPDSDSQMAGFTVVFAGSESAVVVEAYAMTPQGCFMGAASPKSAEERVSDKSTAPAAALLSMQIPARGAKP